MSYYRNKVPMSLGGQKVIVHLDFNAMKAIGARYGKFAAKKLHGATQGEDIDVLLHGLVAGLEREQPGEYTVEKIEVMDPQPPMETIEEVVFESLMAFQYGGAGPLETNPLKRLWSWMLMLMNRLIQYFRRKTQPTALV